MARIPTWVDCGDRYTLLEALPLEEQEKIHNRNIEALSRLAHNLKITGQGERGDNFAKTLVAAIGKPEGAPPDRTHKA